MITYPSFSIIWGNRENALVPDLIKGKKLTDVSNNHPLSQLRTKIGANAVLLNHQVHGIEGHVVDSGYNPSAWLIHEGDFLVTNRPNVALGILTADCLPLVIYDPKNHAIALIHAGWKGLVGGIIDRTIETLNSTYGTVSHDIIFFCGPAARVCCYEVQNDFLETLKYNPYARSSFQEKDNRLFFSLEAYTRALLNKHEIPEDHQNFSNHICTICSETYYSYRRDKKTPYRNITLVSLK